MFRFIMFATTWPIRAEFQQAQLFPYVFHYGLFYFHGSIVVQKLIPQNLITSNSFMWLRCCFVWGAQRGPCCAFCTCSSSRDPPLMCVRIGMELHGQPQQQLLLSSSLEHQLPLCVKAGVQSQEPKFGHKSMCTCLSALVKSECEIGSIVPVFGPCWVGAWYLRGSVAVWPSVSSWWSNNGNQLILHAGC